MIPPKPASRPERVGLWRYGRLFRQDILSAQPDKLYGAWMAEFRTPFFRSFLANDPDLVRRVLKDEPEAFPKSDRISEGLRPLLGRSVFVTNGQEWTRQRRIIDPAFEGGRLRDVFPQIWAAGEQAAPRWAALATGRPVEVEAITSHLAADVIFRTLFSIPIDAPLAAEVFDKFRTYQRAQPLLNPRAFLPRLRFLPGPTNRASRAAARDLRQLIARLVDERAQAIAHGTAPDDLATKIMTTPDPVTGERFQPEEMVDQVAIFFLAGHETSASALAWALYLCALYPDWQDRVAAEGAGLVHDFGALSTLKNTRNLFRETLRLYPPVPMMVREALRAVVFRGRAVRARDQVVISPWHLHRHRRFWEDPDGFDPTRWDQSSEAQRTAYLPFSTGPRVCPGAGFAMLEGTLLLAMILRNWRLRPVEERPPVPVAHLTVRAKEGIWLKVTPRA